MTELIAGIEIPDTEAAADTTRLVSESTSPLLYHHSRRTFLFATLHARRLALEPDVELLYIASMFHDVGLQTPFSDKIQRFEVDGADHVRRFLLERGFSSDAADTAWEAVALHSTPEIPGRMGPEIALTHLGVLTDVVGFGFDGIDSDTIAEITAVHPRENFKHGFIRELHDGVVHRPQTTYGAINADALEHHSPGFPRINLVERVKNSPWAE
ncbi:HD domain-containing protein [Gryllotalpicola daejeonensis]|uniref:HD domain-containing protein n=1 Tax=Gryllotalpicola daejeonensis TaxID=993087 RepID=A0ABP7ZK35_9MICO